MTFRPMFGGILAYAEGKPFASLSDVGLALKLPGGVREELLALSGAKPLRYEPDAPESKTYVVAPEAMLEEAEALRARITRSAETVRMAPAKSSKKVRGKVR